MAKTVSEPPGGWAPKRRSGSKYDEYLDGQVWMLERGKDFGRNVKALSVAFAIRVVAKKRGLLVRTRLRSEDVIYVQAYKKETVNVEEVSSGEE